jgi:hypothetical protein
MAATHGIANWANSFHLTPESIDAIMSQYASFAHHPALCFAFAEFVLTHMGHCQLARVGGQRRETRRWRAQSAAHGCQAGRPVHQRSRLSLLERPSSGRAGDSDRNLIA